MTHKRKLILDRAVVVSTGLATTGTNVFQSRVYSLEALKLPALSIYLGEEEVIEGSVVMGQVGTVQVPLYIEVNVKENDDYDDTLDAILEEHQTAMASERSSADAGALLTIVEEYEYAGLEDVEYEGEGDKEQAKQRIVYHVKYEQTL